MFAKTNSGAKCLADYGRIKEGAIVPETNELYEDVQAWLNEGNEWAPLPAPTLEQINFERITEIDTRLTQIDFESVRPLRAISNASQTQADIDKLNELDVEAATLREERASLS